MKVLSKFLVLSLVFSLFSSSMVFANDMDFQKTVEQRFETALKSKQAPVNAMTLKNDNGIEYTVDVYAIDTSDLTSETEGVDSITYVASTDNMQLISPLTKGSLSDDLWDSSQSVHFYSTIYFNSSTDYPPKYLLTKVSGNYSIVSGQSVSVKNQVISYGCESLSEIVKNQHDTKKITGSSYSYSTGYTKYIHEGAGASMGVNWTGTIQRGSSWNFEFSNYKFMVAPINE